MPTFQRAWLLIVLILLVHLAAIFFGWYQDNTWFDIPMHFAGGFAIAMLALAAWNATIKKITFQKSLRPMWQPAVYLIGIIGVVALVGVAWEWYEFIFDSLIVIYKDDYHLTQAGLGDTMADLALDLLGAVLAFTIFRNRSAK